MVVVETTLLLHALVPTPASTPQLLQTVVLAAPVTFTMQHSQLAGGAPVPHCQQGTVAMLSRSQASTGYVVQHDWALTD